MLKLVKHNQLLTYLEREKQKEIEKHRHMAVPPEITDAVISAYDEKIKEVLLSIEKLQKK